MQQPQERVCETTTVMQVVGVGVNTHGQSRCAHWHSDLDVLALQSPCCSKFYACATCHDALEDHPLQPWPADTKLSTKVLLCGVCEATFSAGQYLSGDKFCPDPACAAPFNPGCRKHWHVHFSAGMLERAAAATGERGYEVEWGGFLTNHLSHGTFALRQLGAPTPLLLRYRELYVVRLSKLPDPLPPAPTRAEALPLLGRRRDYATLLSLYLGEVRELGTGGAMARWLPELLPGLAGAALHGLIHVGVATRQGESWLVAEGMAYLHHSYLALLPGGEAEAGGSGSGVGVGGGGGGGGGDSAVAEDGCALPSRLVEAALVRAGAIPAVSSSGRFQRALAGLYHDAVSASRLRSAAAGLALRIGLGGAEEDRDGAAAAAALLFDEAIRLYAGSCNDYFLLHACTAAWALRQVLPSLQPAAAKAAVHAVGTAVVAACWVQGYSETPPPPAEATRRRATPAAALAAAAALTRALFREGEEPRNEHVYKLCFIVVERLEELAAGGEDQGGGGGSVRCAELLAAVAMVAGPGDFSGRGSGERPTAAVDLGAAPPSMHQLAGVEA